MIIDVFNVNIFLSRMLFLNIAFSTTFRVDSVIYFLNFEMIKCYAKI